MFHGMLPGYPSRHHQHETRSNPGQLIMSMASSILPAPAAATRSAARFALVYKLTISVTILLSIVLISGVYRVGSNSLLAGGFLGAVFIYLASPPEPDSYWSVCDSWCDCRDPLPNAGWYVRSGFGS